MLQAVESDAGPRGQRVHGVLCVFDFEPAQLSLAFCVLQKEKRHATL